MEKNEIDFFKLKEISNSKIDLKLDNGSNLKIEIPAQSRIKINFNAFCMDEGKLAPCINEPYIFSYEMLDMPMFFKIMLYLNTHPEVDSDFRQNLIWKLCKKIKFKDLSKSEQEFLFEIDEYADAEINNYKNIKYKEWNGLPEKHWPQEILPRKIPNSEVFAKFLQINGFFAAEVELYNPNNYVCDLFLLKTNPGQISGKFLNKDRQRLGMLYSGNTKFKIKTPLSIAGIRG